MSYLLGINIFFRMSLSFFTSFFPIYRHPSLCAYARAITDFRDAGINHYIFIAD